MAIIKGNDVLFSYWDAADQELKSFACARSITINMTVETIGKSTAGSGNWKEKEMAVMSWDFSQEGIQYLDVDGQMSVTDIIDLFMAGEPVVVSLYSVDEGGDNEYYLNGNAILTQVSPNGAVNNLASLSITGEGTGPLVKDGPAEYGNYPANLHETGHTIDDPEPGINSYTFAWDNAVPSPAGYYLKIRNTTNNSYILQAEPGLSGTIQTTDASPFWGISIASVYVPNVIVSAFSPEIIVPF